MDIASQSKHLLTIFNTEKNTQQGNERCGFCLKQGFGYSKIVDVTSVNFTDWDKTINNTICPSCVDILTNTQYRTNIIYISGEKWEFLSPNATVDRLLDSPLQRSEALNIPLSGRKHTLLNAMWGLVSTDSGAFPWGDKEIRLLQNIIFLKEMGFTRHDLSQPMISPKNINVTMFHDFSTLAKKIGTVQSWSGHPLYQSLLKIVYAEQMS